MQPQTPYNHDLLGAAETAVQAIPPAWPLEATVAVNPFLGQAKDSLEHTSALFQRIAGVRLALPRSHYARKVLEGAIVDDDIADAIGSRQVFARLNLAQVKQGLLGEPAAFRPIASLAQIASAHDRRDWVELISDRITNFASGYFDAGQALWAAPQDRGLFASWRLHAMHDLTPELSGLSGFASHVAHSPATPEGAFVKACQTLGIGDPGTYFHQLLVSMGGWAQHARHLGWLAERDGHRDNALFELLAVRITFDEALYKISSSEVQTRWSESLAAHRQPISPSIEDLVDAVLQSAAELAHQRALKAALQRPSTSSKRTERPTLQAAFCIDVRSEPFRRALESADAGVQTIGFAGFFGIGSSFRRRGSVISENRLPVLIKPSIFACEASSDSEGSAAQIAARAKRAWSRFKVAAVSSFAFVEAAGPLSALPLVRSTLATGRADRHVHPLQFSLQMTGEEKTAIAEAALRGMGLTDEFARTVLLIGHGSTVTNNPFASALQCGACGGHAGDVSARLLAMVLNEADVRSALADRGIDVPVDTIFVSGLHDTTSDEVTLFESDLPESSDKSALVTVRRWLDQAGDLTRAERTIRLRGSSRRTIGARGRQWAQMRPEAGLAGCSAFIAAPRDRTRCAALDGRVFLHDYDWRRDNEFKILELILTAPVVVASWIGLQYFGSAVAPSMFGSGNKLLHNVVGGIGVIEGNGGNLRAGLPWQSVHDGLDLMHDPRRLTVAIEAPKEQIAMILSRHPTVRSLFDNGWLHLVVMDDQGRMAWRYHAGLDWKPIDGLAEDAGLGLVA